MQGQEISRLALPELSEIQHKGRPNRTVKPAHQASIALAIVLGHPLVNVTPGITAL